MNRLAVLGASGHGKVVADLAQSCGWEHIEFFDDHWPSISDNGVWPVVGDTPRLFERLEHYGGVVVAIGNNAVRQQKIAELRRRSVALPTLVHPSAVVSRHAVLAQGTVVMAGAVINAFASVGSGSIINTASSVDHDCVLGDCVHISPGARLAGAVMIGNQGWVGIGAVIRQQTSVGSRVVVGAGAVVVADVPDDTTVVGVPAQPLIRPR